jgi:2-polyprenyl-6-methoxyphenol hydroxylase-like FAD-dependent oxidoreductase
VDIFGGRPLPRWGARRVALLGDAAHPMTTILGQGACMALEDGAALARQLGRGGDIGGGLRAYEAERHDRSTRMMRLVGHFSPRSEGPFRARVRNQAIKRVFHRGLGGRLEALIAEPFENNQEKTP